MLILVEKRPLTLSDKLRKVFARVNTVDQAQMELGGVLKEYIKKGHVHEVSSLVEAGLVRARIRHVLLAEVYNQKKVAKYLASAVQQELFYPQLMQDRTDQAYARTGLYGSKPEAVGA